MFLAFDPTLIFCIGCLMAPLMVLYVKKPEDLQKETIRHFSDPAILAGVAFITLAFLLTRGSKTKLSSLEKLISNWILLNGGIIHLTMDGLTGGYHFLPLMYENYCIVDKRFKTDEPNSWIITQIELFIMCPLCFFAYIAFWRGSIQKYCLCIVVSCLQIAGALVFSGAEIFANFPNTPVDRKFEFTNDHILYFWFGFGANIIWLVIPTFIIIYSMKQIGKIDIKLKSE